jgi:hypothetical protein
MPPFLGNLSVVKMDMGDYYSAKEGYELGFRNIQKKNFGEENLD